jgi:hypothetical protein
MTTDGNGNVGETRCRRDKDDDLGTGGPQLLSDRTA